MTGDSRSALIEQYRREHAEVVQTPEAVTAGSIPLSRTRSLTAAQPLPDHDGRPLAET